MPYAPETLRGDAVRRDFYAVLGVDRRASGEEIKRAYRRLTLEHHPDRHPGEPDAQERYREINAAYDVLGDPAKRARYDNSLRLQQGLDLSKGFDRGSARDLFSSVFGGRVSEQKTRSQKGTRSEIHLVGVAA